MKKIISMAAALLIVAVVASLVLIGLVAGIYAVITGVGSLLGITANTTSYYIVSVCIAVYLMSDGADRVPLRTKI